MFQPKAHTTPSKAARAEKSMPLERTDILHQSIRYHQAGIKMQEGKMGNSSYGGCYIGVYVASNMTDDIHILLLLLPK